jgi:hypothetical protein
MSSTTVSAPAAANSSPRTGVLAVADGAKADASTDFDVGHRIADQDARGWSAIDDARGPFDRIRKPRSTCTRTTDRS